MIRLRINRKLESFDLAELYLQVKSKSQTLKLSPSQIKRILQLGSKLETKEPCERQTRSSSKTVENSKINHSKFEQSPMLKPKVVDIPDQSITRNYIQSLLDALNDANLGV